MQYYNPDDYAADTLDADPRSDGPYWIYDEDGSGHWSDGWTGDDPANNDYPYEDGDEWLGPMAPLDEIDDTPF